jgi:hypothetical protein
MRTRHRLHLPRLGGDPGIARQQPFSGHARIAQSLFTIFGPDLA